MDTRLLELYGSRLMEERIKAAEKAQQARKCLTWQRALQRGQQIQHERVHSRRPMGAALQETSAASPETGDGVLA